MSQQSMSRTLLPPSPFFLPTLVMQCTVAREPTKPRSFVVMFFVKTGRHTCCQFVLLRFLVDCNATKYWCSCRDEKSLPAVFFNTWRLKPGHQRAGVQLHLREQCPELLSETQSHTFEDAAKRVCRGELDSEHEPFKCFRETVFASMRRR
jgi:hypothetical protein